MRRAPFAPCLLLAASCGPGHPSGAVGGAALIADFEARHAQAQLGLAVAPDAATRHAVLSQAYVGEALTERFRRAESATRRREDTHTRLILDEVTNERTEIVGASSRGIELEAHWRTRGSVEHSGHVHPRHLRATARFWIIPADPGWRIAALSPIDWVALPSAAPTPVAPYSPDPR